MEKIKVIKTWAVNIGENRLHISDSEDYRLTMNDGTTRIVHISGVLFEDSAPTGLNVSLDIKEGSFNPIKESNEIIDISEVVNVERVHLQYNSIRRNVRYDDYYWGNNPQYFTFIIPGPKRCRITVAKGEFIALTIRPNNGRGHILFGEIDAIYGDDIYFNQYSEVDNVRCIEHCKINITDLRGVYHYELCIKDHVTSDYTI